MIINFREREKIMSYLISFIICTAMSLVNLPFVLQEGGSIINLCAMIFCAGLAMFSLLAAIKSI